MKDSKAFWDDSAEKYVKSPIKDQATYEKKLDITREYLSKDSRVLEFGCGSGATAMLHAPFVKEIVASDLSEKMIELARQQAEQQGIEGIEFRQGTLATLDLAPESFDAVLGLNVLHLLDDVNETIQRVYDVLKPGGVFVSSTSLIGEVNFLFRGLISAMQFVGMAPYVSRFTQQQLLDMLQQAGFSIETQWRTSHESIFIVARKEA